MQDRDYTVAADFLKRLFAETLQNVELRACANERGASSFSIFTRDPGDIEAFCRRRDADGWGVYFGVCTRGDLRNERGAISGAKTNVAECPALWVDIDCAKQGIGGDEAIRALEFLPFPPSIIVNSGGGLHAYWVLEEATDQFEAVEAACRQLAYVLAGDTSCAEVARILRLPGTANSKPATLALNGGSPAITEILSDNGHVYDFEALVEWLGEQRALLHGKFEAAKPVRPDDPFVAYARDAGYNPAIDIDEALAAMAYGASGDASVHQTQLRVSASMLARGYDDDEIVARILAATEAAAPGDARWNWAREEKAIRDMVRSARGKGFDKPRERNSPAPAAAPVAGNTALKLVHDAEPKAAPKAKTTDEDRQAKMVVVAEAVISVWAEEIGPLMHFDGSTYSYASGVWTLWNPALEQRMRQMIQRSCASLNVTPTTSTLNSAYRYIMERPELARREVSFDQHGLIIAEDGVVDPATGAIGDHDPGHLALFKVAAKANGSRDCIAWLDFLRQTFGDKGDDADPIILTLQEWFGAMLVARKPRATKLGLLAHGPSRTGKTQIAQVARGLLGLRHVSGARMRDLEGRFGMEPFLGKRGWIADDAIGEGEYLDADTYKVVVTGEETSVQCKGGRNVETRFGFPVMLTANNLPRVKDQSDAVYNRSLILPCTNVRDERAPEPVGYNSIAEKIIAEELTGVLWWAFEGWRRLSARGCFDPPKVMADAKKGFESTNNPVGTWREECLELNAESKVQRSDLLASMNGWWTQEYGADAKLWSGRGFFPKLTQLIPGYSKETHDTTDDDGNRILIGVRLNKAGLLAWRVHKDSRWGAESKTSSEEAYVNRVHEFARPQRTGRTVF